MNSFVRGNAMGLIDIGSSDVCYLMHQPLHYNENVILTTFSPLAALEIVKMTTSNAGSDENFKMITFPFHSH